MSKRLSAWLSVAALSVFASSLEAAPSLVGDQVSITSFFPNLSTVQSGPVTPIVVSPNAECIGSDDSLRCLNLFAGESLNIEAQSISGVFVAGFDSNATFNGYEFNDLDFTEGASITGVSLVNNTIAGLDAADIRFDADTVWVDLRGASAGTFTINLQVGPVAIPEPGALALAGLALAGLVASRRRRQ